MVKPQDRVSKNALALLDTEQVSPVNQDLSVPLNHRATSTKAYRYRTYALQMMDTVSCIFHGFQHKKHDVLNITLYSTVVCV